MLRRVLLSKIDGGVVTEKKLYYEGSITIDETILKEANIFPGEKVEVLNVNNGSRIETYVIKGEKESGKICINGPASRFFEIDDKIIILCYGLLGERELIEHRYLLIKLDKKNKIKSKAIL